MSRPTKLAKYNSKDLKEYAKTLDYDLDQLYSKFQTLIKLSKLHLNTGTGTHINFSGDTANTSSNDGDVWFDGTNLKINVGGTAYNIDKTPA